MLTKWVALSPDKQGYELNSTNLSGLSANNCCRAPNESIQDFSIFSKSSVSFFSKFNRLVAEPEST